MAQATGQGDRAEAYANESADLDAEGFPEPPYLTVAPFLQDAVIPMVGTFTAGIGETYEMGGAIVEFDSGTETFLGVFVNRPEDAHCVFAL